MGKAPTGIGGRSIFIGHQDRYYAQEHKHPRRARAELKLFQKHEFDAQQLPAMILIIELSSVS